MSKPVGYFEQEYVGGPVLFYQVNYKAEGSIPLYAHPDPRIAELEAVLKIALKQLEEWEVTIDSEFGYGRQLDEIEAAGDLSEATVAVRAALKEIK